MSEFDDLRQEVAAKEALRREKRLATRRAASKRYYAKMKAAMTAEELTIHNKQFRKRWEARVGRKELTKRALAGRLRRQVLEAGPKPDLCQVCNRGGRIVFDHCHNSDKFRGWLCHNCNVILGLVDDDREILLKLVEYLDAHK